VIGRSLSARLTSLLQTMAVLVVAVFAGSSMWLTARAIEREERALLRDAAHRIAIDLDQEFREERDLTRAAAAVLEEEAASGFRIDIIDSAGRTLASSSRTPMGRDLEQAIVSTASGAIVTVSVSHQMRMATVAALGRALLLAAAPLLLLTLLLSRRLIRSALGPLSEMERRARDASTEEAVRSIGPMFGLTEIDALRDSFDRLLARLDDLLQSERRFTSDASHELKTPLTVLSGELEMALSRSDLPSGARTGLERASEQVRTMRELVEALLLLRRAQGGPDSTSDAVEPVNLTDLAGETARAALLRDPSRAADLCVCGPDEVLVLGHPVLLASGLRNLIENAIKFTEPGQPIRVIVEADGEDARVTVDDGGPGIPLSERERVFDPFFRGAEARAYREGTGLGLPILRQVARAHGGEVSAGESPLGGARLVIRLPLLRTA